jgi:hypothetical protein
MTFWIIVTIVAIVFFGWLIYEAVTAPVMPDDYDVRYYKKEKDIEHDENE